MIALDFLEAADGTPLTKTFTLKPDGTYEVSSYPMLMMFNSHREEVEGIEEFLDVVVAHANAHHCLTKGLLSAPIVGASRKGLTDAAQPATWLCLDLDFYEGWPSIDAFLADLDPVFADVSYIFQHSASAGMRAPVGLRGHVFILLAEAVAPNTVKLWLRARNLTVDRLTDQLALSATGMALKWPLDTTTCQNDKLLYITPPVCVGFEDPLKDQRFTLVRKGVDYCPRIEAMHTLVPAAIDEGTRAAVRTLREAANLPTVKLRMKFQRDVEYLANPDKCNVTGVLQARGYVYLNLNGGDSWGYWFPEDNPEFVHNFKGEPVVKLRDIAPDFYVEFQAGVVRRARESREFSPLVFRDASRDVYYNVLVYPEQGKSVAYKAGNKTKLQDFMAQYNEAVPKTIEDWHVEFDPRTLEVIDVDRKWFNLFQPTPYLINANRPDRAPHMPPTIGMVLNSICVNDPEVLWRFTNWLAYIVQTRKKTGTAWVFHGNSGTGKGIFLSRVLKPLFGARHVLEYTVQQFEEQFNGPIEESLILWIDEFHYESAKSSGLVMNKLKNLITEDTIPIRAMRQEVTFPQNFTNLIIATNHPDPVRLAAHDRRFNIAPGQETALQITTPQVEALEREIPMFVSYLMWHTVDEQQVRTVVLNEARENMIVAAQTSVEALFEAFRNGDLDFFLEFLQAKMPLQDSMLYSTYEGAAMEWSRAAVEKRMCIVSLTQLQAAYNYIVGMPASPMYMKRTLARHRCQFERELGGAPVNWTVDPVKLHEVIERRASKPRLQLVKEEPRAAS